MTRESSGIEDWIRRLLWSACVLVLGAVLGLASMAGGTARANGVPLRIPLSYLDGISNWGPTDAHGTAELSYAEGLLRMEIDGLPPLSGQAYAAWLVNTATNRAVAAGTFAPGDGGATMFDGKLTDLKSYDYDMVVVTVEAAGGSVTAPSSQRSIGGYFVAVQAPSTTANGSATDTQPTGAAPPQMTPATLPYTGDVPAPRASSNGWRTKAAAALFGIGGISIWLALRRRRVQA